MKRYCLALDLIDDTNLIAAYEDWHQRIPGEIKKSITDAGITSMEIYRIGNRLFMIMETTEAFSFDQKTEMDNSNPAVQNWEEMMWKYQQPLPFAKQGEKWLLMNKIFDLDKN
jgi:L-rhamnose mutarotase